MKKYVVLKLIGLAILAMITLVIISILEVTLYSYVVNPGQDVSVYEEHAKFSAPFISGIFGFIIFFLVSHFYLLNSQIFRYPNNNVVRGI